MTARRSAQVAVLCVLLLTACGGGASSLPPSAAGADATDAAAAATGTSGTGQGGEIVFQADGSIWTQATGEQRVAAAPGVASDNQHPDWSPDGRQIAFEANFVTIWTVDSEGQGEHAWFSCDEPCAAVYEPAWSPDGRSLAFMQILGDGTHTVSAQLLRLDLADGTTSVIHEDTAGDVWEYTPRWSGDSTRLVVERDIFASNRLDESQTLSSDLRVVDAGNGETSPIPHTSGAQSPDWSRTADVIVFTDGRNLFTIHPDGTHRTPLTHFVGRGQSALQPTFSPDGEDVIFTWVKGAPGSGNETTMPGILTLDSGELTAFRKASGATHVRPRP